MPADPALLLAAAVKAACQSKAPRRTVAAVAAAVTSALVTPAVHKTTVPSEAAGTQEIDGDSCTQLAQQLRASRAATRRLRRQRKREARAAATTACADAIDGRDLQAKPIGGIVEAEVTSRTAPPPNLRDPTGETPPGKRFCEVTPGPYFDDDDGGAEGKAMVTASPSVSVRSIYSADTACPIHPGFPTWYDAVLNTGVARFTNGQTRPVCRADLGDPDLFSKNWYTTASGPNSALEQGSSWMVFPKEQRLTGHRHPPEPTLTAALAYIAVFVS